MRSRHMRFSAGNQIILICIIMTAFFLGCRKQPTVVSQVPDKTKVIVRPIASVATKDTILLSGALEAEKTVPLSFLVPGKVNSIHRYEGDYVEAGQTLSTIESDDYRSHLEIAEAIFLKAKDEYEMYHPIYMEGAFAKKDFINIETNLATSMAERDIARKKVKDTELKAPFSGTVGHKNIEIGQLVSPGMPAFTVVKIDIIFARLAVPESEIGKISLGQIAEITIPAMNDLMVRGEITMIGPLADLRTRTYPVKVLLTNAEYTLHAGMIVQAKIITNDSVNTLTVPGNSIVRDADDLTYVFVADKVKNRALRHRVEIGSVLLREVEIKSGLMLDDLIIVGGQNKLTDGSEIIITAEKIVLEKTE